MSQNELESLKKGMSKLGKMVRKYQNSTENSTEDIKNPLSPLKNPLKPDQQEMDMMTFEAVVIAHNHPEVAKLVSNEAEGIASRLGVVGEPRVRNILYQLQKNISEGEAR